MKTSELTGPELDYWAGKAAEQSGLSLESNVCYIFRVDAPSFTDSSKTIRSGGIMYRPSTDWSQGGPLIEKYYIELGVNNDMTWWACTVDEYQGQQGPAPLIAAMRALVASKYGDKVDE